MAVAAVRIVAQQQVGVFVRQQSGELSRGFLNICPREPGLARRILEQDRPVSAVRVAEMHGLVRAEDRGARPQLVQPPTLIRAGHMSPSQATTMITRWPSAASRAIVPPVSSTSSSG
jgi:hypothetical protein